MSHKTELKTKLNNISHITKALDELGCKYVVGNNLVTKSHYIGTNKVDILIKEVKGKSTNDAVGLVKQSDGSFTITGDFYGTGVNESWLKSNLVAESTKVSVSDELTRIGFELASKSITTDKQYMSLEYSRWI